MVLSMNQDTACGVMPESSRRNGRRAATDLDLLHDRRLDVLRQVDLHLAHCVAHVGHRAIDRRADAEFDVRFRPAFLGDRGDVVDVADAGDGGLDPAHDLGFDLLGGDAGLADVHRHHRVIKRLLLKPGSATMMDKKQGSNKY